MLKGRDKAKARAERCKQNQTRLRGTSSLNPLQPVLMPPQTRMEGPTNQISNIRQVEVGEDRFSVQMRYMHEASQHRLGHHIP